MFYSIIYDIYSICFISKHLEDKFFNKFWKMFTEKKCEILEVEPWVSDPKNTY